MKWFLPMAQKEVSSYDPDIFFTFNILIFDFPKGIPKGAGIKNAKHGIM